MGSRRQCDRGIPIVHTMMVAFVGCGGISNVRFRMDREYRNLEIVACADLDRDRARARSAG
jgi:predicted dehydrogenase